MREIRMLAGKLGVPVGEEPLGSVSHHFRGGKQFTGARHFGRVVYRDVYPGVDLQFRMTGKSVEYDFVVRPHAGASAIRMRFDGARVFEGAGGELVLRAGEAELRHRKPVVLQDGKTIDGAFAVRRGEVRFELGTYDPSKPLVIDPVVEFATLLGGGSIDYINATTTDSAGNIYLVGTTYSAPPYAFPNKLGVLAPLTPEGDVFVTKISSDGKTLIWTAFLGGRFTDSGSGIALGSDGSVFVTGATTSPDFPTTTGVYQPQLSTQSSNYYSPSDAFVARLGPAGDTVLYSTYLGGAGNDGGQRITVDSGLNAFVAGNTNSYGFPTTSNALRATKTGQTADLDVFVSKLSPLGNLLLYSTFWGGFADESVGGLAVDATGAVYVAGNTASTDFITTAGTIKPAANLNYYSDGDGFVTKFIPGTATPIYSTFYGGSSRESITSLAVDAAGNAHIAGQTSSYDFPLLPVPGTRPNISADVFAAKINPTATAILYSRVIPASGEDIANSIALDSTGVLYVAGSTSSGNFPLVGTPAQSVFSVSDNNQRVGFLMALSPAGGAHRLDIRFRAPRGN